jgi:DNA-binding transcriptional LysR family regulator
MTNLHKLDNLEELRTFVQIVEAGSLARAASALAVSPNAVSRRLAQLEERLAHRLIHRTTRRMAVTDEGQRLYQRCRHVLDELEEAERELVGSDGLDGTLRVALHAGVVGATLVGGLARLLAETGRLRLQVRVISGPADPIRERLDLALYVGKPPASSLVAVALPTVSWGLAAAPAYVALHGKPRAPTELAQHQCLRVLREPPEAHWHLSRGTGRARRFAISGRFETDDGGLLTAALYAGIGVGLRPRPEIEAAVRAGTLVAVLPAWQWAATPLYALLPPGRQRLPAVRRLLEVLRASTDKLG